MLRLFKKIPYVEALRAFLEQWGLWGWISIMSGTVISILYSWGTWLFYNVPVWLAPLLGLLLISGIMAVFYYGLLIMRWLRAYRLDLPALGGQLVEFSGRFSRDINDYDRRLTALPRPRDIEDPYQEWASGASKMKSDWIAEAYGGELVYYLRELSRLGIPVPFHLTASIEYGARGLAAFLGYVGRMLKEGRIEELKAVNRGADWTISTMFR
jgi:hypothetical protein